MHRLRIVADLIRDARHSAVELHDPENGDTRWSLACRGYSRTCHAIRQAAEVYAWLKVLREYRLAFTFSIGEFAFKFYRGSPSDHYRIERFIELYHQQSVLDEGWFPRENILQLAVEVDLQTLEVVSVTVVEMDVAENITGTYPIPHDSAGANVAPAVSPGVDVPPVSIEPLRNTEEEENPNENAEL